MHWVHGLSEQGLIEGQQPAASTCCYANDVGAPSKEAKGVKSRDTKSPCNWRWTALLSFNSKKGASQTQLRHLEHYVQMYSVEHS